MKKLVFDIGGTEIKYALMDDEAIIYEKGRCQTPLDSFESLMSALIEIYELVKEQINGIAISLPGVIDAEKGFIHMGGALLYNQNIAFVEKMHEYISLPIAIENDGKAAALAELWLGNLRESQSGVVIVLGTGIGGGVVINRKLIKGSHFFAGEFSLLTSNDAISLKDVFASRASTASLVYQFATAKGLNPKEVNGHYVFERIHEQDDDAICALDNICRAIAAQIFNFQCILDPDKVLIGGGISKQPLVLSTIQKFLAEMYSKIPFPFPQAQLDTCRFHNDSNLIGALYNFFIQFPRKEH